MPQLLDESEDHQLLQNAYEHLAKLLGSQWHPLESIETLAATPQVAKHIWYLWWFQAEVGGSGISGWLVNHAPATSVVIASHAALKAVGATHSLEMLEAGFAPARAWDAPFLQSKEVAWFDQFRGNPKWPSFDEIDVASCDICSGPLSVIAAKYIREHRSEL
jgi:hypothetical protein